MNNDHNTLEQMDIRLLEVQLRQELEKDQKADPERVKSLLQAIDRRKDEYSFTDDVNVQAACDKYRTRQKQRQERKQRRLSIVAAALAAMLVLVILPQAVQAESIWDMLARWTESVFAFFTPEETPPEYVFQTEDPGLRQIYDAVTQLGVTEPVVPMWIPEGYTLTECTTYRTPVETYVHARLVNGDSELVFDVKCHTGTSALEYYKDGSLVEEWEYNGVVHYILQNEDDLVAVWTRENVECFLSVDCQEDVLYEMLKSIYTMGDS